MNQAGWLLCGILAIAGLWDAHYWLFIGLIMIGCAVEQYRQEIIQKAKS